MPDGVAGVLYLLCGVVFSIDILPSAFSWIGKAMPWTYWLEALRRILVGSPFISSLSELSNGAVFMRLTATTIATVIAAWVALRGAERLAIAMGKLDERTDY